MTDPDPIRKYVAGQSFTPSPGSAYFEMDEEIEVLFRLRPKEMCEMTERAASAIRQMWETLYAMDNEAEKIFRGCMVTARFRPPMVSPVSCDYDGKNQKVCISSHQTPIAANLEKAASKTKSKMERIKRRENKLELQLYELKSKLG
jgi:hypothetical protein